MAYKPTGKPVGRPKTKEYQTFSLKIPQSLIDQVKRYARQHRQSVAELIREGLEWRIGEGDPLAQRYATADSSEQEHSGIPETPPWPDRDSESEGPLEEIRHTLTRQESQLQALTQALENRPGTFMPSEYLDAIMEALTGRQSNPEPVQKGNSGQTPQKATIEISNTRVQGSTQLTDRPDKAAPTFDTSKFMLGELCKNQHDFDGQGHSLRYIRGDRACQQCKQARDSRHLASGKPKQKRKERQAQSQTA
jgi:hypothetical protein